MRTRMYVRTRAWVVCVGECTVGVCVCVEWCVNAVSFGVCVRVQWSGVTEVTGNKSPRRARGETLWRLSAQRGRAIEIGQSRHWRRLQTRLRRAPVPRILR